MSLENEAEEDLPVATVVKGGDDAHGGPGWYYYDEDYQDEGSCGAFGTREEAEAHAKAAGYRIDAPEEPRNGRVLG